MQDHFTHDAFFRYIFGDERHLESFLLAVLPELARGIAWPRVRLEDPSVFDETLKASTADLLWHLPLRASLSRRLRRGCPGFVLLLLEHKSHPDPNVLFDVFLRILRLWNREPRTGPKVFVLPMLVANTPRDWDPTAAAARVLCLPEALRLPLPLPRIEHVRLDPDLERALPADWDLKAAVRAMWVVAQGLVRKEIATAFEYAARGTWSEGDPRFAEALLRYVMSGKMDMEPAALVELVRRTLRREGDVDMTTYIEHFRREGRQEGWREGRQEASRRAILRLLEQRFGGTPEELRRRLEEIHDPGTLEDLVVTAGTCQSLAEFWTKLPT